MSQIKKHSGWGKSGSQPHSPDSSALIRVARNGRNVQQEKTPSSDPQKGSVSLPSFGSGVLISAEGKILTAAHVVQHVSEG